MSWGGAQWVLATLFAVFTVVPLSFRASGMSKKSFEEWWGWYLSELIPRAGLIVILWWGGFWS